MTFLLPENMQYVVNEIDTAKRQQHFGGRKKVVSTCYYYHHHHRHHYCHFYIKTTLLQYQ